MRWRGDVREYDRDRNHFVFRHVEVWGEGGEPKELTPEMGRLPLDYFPAEGDSALSCYECTDCPWEGSAVVRATPPEPMDPNLRIELELPDEFYSS